MGDEIQRQALARSIAIRLQLLTHGEMRVVDDVVTRLCQRASDRRRPVEAIDDLIAAVETELAEQDRERAPLREAARAEMFPAAPPVPPEVWAERDRLVAVARDDVRSKHFAHCVYEESNGVCKRDGYGMESHCTECYEAAQRPGAAGAALREYRDRDVSIGIPGDYVSLKPMDLDPAGRMDYIADCAQAGAITTGYAQELIAEFASDAHLTRVSGTPATLALADVARDRDEDLEVELEWGVDRGAGEGR